MRLLPAGRKAREVTFAEVTLLVAALLAFGDPALPQTQSPQTRIIHVEVVGLHSDKGQVLCALYSSPDGFPKQSEKALARVSSPIAQKQAVCEFSAVAISVFHDENSNGKLDSKFMGIPREGVGASNGARGHLGPPKFEAAAFSFSGGRLELQVAIIYL